MHNFQIHFISLISLFPHASLSASALSASTTPILFNPCSHFPQILPTITDCYSSRLPSRMIILDRTYDVHWFIFCTFLLVFAAQCYAQARPMSSRGVCLSVLPSVCLSVTFVHSVEMNKHISNIVSPWSSHTILVFPHQTSWQYFYGNTPNRGR